jgi:phytoene dehydrogenase-like protein
VCASDRVDLTEEDGAPLTCTFREGGAPAGAWRAPEEAEQRFGQPAGEVYRLGRLLCLVLQPDLSEDPRARRRWLRDQPPLLRHLLQRAMARHPARRQARSAAYAADLDAYLSGEVLRVRPRSIVRRLFDRLRLRPQ